MDKLFEMLKKIQKCPRVYLMDKSLTLLSEFINGYMFCQNDYLGEQSQLFEGFEEYIHKKYNIFTTHSAIQIINFFSVTEDRAFDKFYELLEEFLKEQELNN